MLRSRRNQSKIIKGLKMTICASKAVRKYTIPDVSLDNDKLGLYKIAFQPCIEGVLQEKKHIHNLSRGTLLYMYEQCEQEQKLNCILCKFKQKRH